MLAKNRAPWQEKWRGDCSFLSLLSGIYLFFFFFLQQLVFWGSQSFSCIHRTEQVYRFFQKWCPNIHNALDDDESEDDEMTDPHYCTAEEEVNRLISLFTVFHFSLRSSRSFAYHSVRRFEHIYIFGREFLACNMYFLVVSLKALRIPWLVTFSKHTDQTMSQVVAWKSVKKKYGKF